MSELRATAASLTAEEIAGRLATYRNDERQRVGNGPTRGVHPRRASTCVRESAAGGVHNDARPSAQRRGSALERRTLARVAEDGCLRHLKPHAHLEDGLRVAPRERRREAAWADCTRRMRMIIIYGASQRRRRDSFNLL